ncbi:hypothetical protein ScalyP_jg2274 [Parmales sp. scaly parma]|nr:hypothetical protein ScalyP_jg2274 [Parmales sp. scaly parma]
MAELDFAAMYQFEKTKVRKAKLATAAPAATTTQIHHLDDASTLLFTPDFLQPIELSSLALFFSNNDSKWISLSNRRLIVYGGTPHPGGTIPQPIPSPIQQLSSKIQTHFASISSLPINNVLVNEYNHHKGIALHNDGPLYHEIVYIYSVNSCLFKLIRESDGERISVFLPDNSIFCFQKDKYKDWKHEIDESEVDIVLIDTINASMLNLEIGAKLVRPNKRISLTFRSLATPFIEESFTSEAIAEEKRKLAWFNDSVSESEGN